MKPLSVCNAKSLVRHRLMLSFSSRINPSSKPVGLSSAFRVCICSQHQAVIYYSGELAGLVRNMST